ncbi:MAG: chromate efflux transporter [Myxococcales bacterium]
MNAEHPPAPEAPAATQPAAATAAPSLGELLKASLFLGAVGFGGGLSVLGLIESLAVQRRRWLTPEQFASTATIAQMLPGGAAANALAALGLRFGGVRGAAACYLGFVLPGATAVLVLAMAYQRFGALPDAAAFLGGLNAAVVGIVLAIAVRMSRTSVAQLWQMGVAAGALLLSLLGGAGSGEVALLGIASGLLWDLGLRRAKLLSPRRLFRPRPVPPAALPEEGSPLSPPLPELPPASKPDKSERAKTHHHLPALLVAALAGPLLFQTLADLASLAVVCFRTGLGAYGGGFAAIPSLQAQVTAHHWLTEAQFADAVAVGKLTPGPVLLAATFVGYLRSGIPGAVVGTLAVFAAPFVLAVTLNSWLEQARSSRWMRAALLGLTPSVVGLMIAAALTLGAGVRSGIGAAIAAAVALTLIRFDRVNPVAMLALGGAARVLYGLAGGD